MAPSSSSQTNITHADFTGFLRSGVFLRDEQQCVLGWGPFSPADTDKKQEISVSCPAFYETEKSLLLRPARFELISPVQMTRLCLQWLENSSEPASPWPAWTEPSREDFDQSFARIQNLIRQGQIDKAVPVVLATSRAHLSAVQKVKMLLELLSAPQTLWPYGYWDEDGGILGATPELLFSIRDRHLSTMALAGTLSKKDGRVEDLVRSAKEQHEHRLVIEDLRKELKVFGHVRVGETGVLDLPSLWHLKTDIDVEMTEEPDVPHLLKALHPTAALGVFPRVFGWRWMRELPGQEARHRYGAPFTLRLGEKRVLSLVAIRNLQWRDETLVLGSGCGLVASSELEKEWNELSRKRQSVLQLLGWTS